MPEFPGRLRPPRLPSAPATPAGGELYYDTAGTNLLWWNGTAWVAASGAGGTTFVSGAGAPAAGTGANGAIYLDTASGRMYGPKAAGAWPATPIGILVRDATTYDQLAKGN